MSGDTVAEILNYQYIFMELLFLIGVVLAIGGIGLVVWQLVLTVVLNCEILEDLLKHRKPRFSYGLNLLNGLTDLTISCHFIREDISPFMMEIVYRNLLEPERKLRVIGKALEMAGFLLIAFGVLLKVGDTSALFILLAAVVAWLVVCLVNFVAAFIVSLFANHFYRQKVQQNA